MPLPPALLRIKRKRTEDPVESLYIETSAASKRAKTDTSYVFRRLLKDADARTTTNTGQETQHAISSSLNRAPNSAFRDRENAHPRRFLLSRSNDRPAGLAGQPNQHILQRGKHDVALLVEDIQSMRHGSSAKRVKAASELEEPSFILSRSAARNPVGSTTTTTTQPTVSPKRPSAKYGVPRPPLPRKFSHSAMQDKMAVLEQWAGEELASMNAKDNTAPHSVNEPSISMDNGRSHPTAKDAMEIDEDGDYVYDTYVRYEAAPSIQPAPTTVASSTLATSSAVPFVRSSPELGNIGYLVITDADVELWDMYASDPDEADEKDDWDSEQDDENAENYYGADYPEDEISSDDEHGEDPYRYRRKHAGLSDDEEYDLAEESGSDGPEPWKGRNVIQSGVYRLGQGEVPYNDDQDDQSV